MVGTWAHGADDDAMIAPATFGDFSCSEVPAPPHRHTAAHPAVQTAPVIDAKSAVIYRSIASTESSILFFSPTAVDRNAPYGSVM